MKKYFAVILALVFAFTLALIGCEKKQQAPKPVQQPAVTPAPAPVPPPPPPPAPTPVKPAKPMKPAKK